MSARFGFVGGVLALTALQAVVSSGEATGRVTGAASGLASLLEHITSPEVPAIPDLRASSSGADPSSFAGTTPEAGTTTATATRAGLNPSARLPVNA